MKYKTIYQLLFLGTLLAGLAFFAFNHKNKWFDDKDVTVITSLVALLISIISLAIADQKLKKFSGRLEIHNYGGKDNSGYSLCRLQLINTGKEPLVGLKVDFRYPNIFNPRGQIKDPEYFKLTQGVVVTNDKYRFLGIEPENNFADFEHWLALERMTTASYISIHANNMEVKTFVLTPTMAQALLTDGPSTVTL